MKESKFKVGDKIKIFKTLNALPVELIGFIEGVNERLIQASTEDVGIIFAHPKQCRRLIKKERRRVWIPELFLFGKAREDGVCAYTTPPREGDVKSIEFIEVRRGK